MNGLISFGRRHWKHETVYVLCNDYKMATMIKGYDLGHAPKAPITLSELNKIMQAALFSEEDIQALRKSYSILENQLEAILDVWYGFVGANDFLLSSFVSKSTGEPDIEYLGAVRERFKQWVLDTAKAEYDQAWLDYQFEIGRRHHRTAKNTTDSSDVPENVPFRYLIPLIVPITTTLRPFLEKGGHTREEVDKMHAAWVKSVTVQVTLWSYPYVVQGDY